MKLHLLLFLFVSLITFKSYSSNNSSDGLPVNWIQPDNMQYTAAFRGQIFKDGILYMPDNTLTLAVFKDEVCRGVKGTYSNNTTSGKFFNLTYASNNVTESGLKFKVYDPSTDKVYDIVEETTFSSGNSLGTPSAPIRLSYFTTSVSNPTSSSDFISITPNPVKNLFTISLNRQEAEVAEINILNISGKKIWSLSRVSLDASGLISIMRDTKIKSGIYFLQLKTGDKSYFGKLIFN